MPWLFIYTFSILEVVLQRLHEHHAILARTYGDQALFDRK